VTQKLPARRLMLVHAHPDDESIGTGATMAKYVDEGAHVTLVTCTLGEEGEVLVPDLAQLAADQADQLGGWRIAELAQAVSELGVTDHRFLGGAGRFRDSGMMGTPANGKPRAFWRADSDPAVFADAVRAMAEVIREVRPQVLISYDQNGGYGHPDHIMSHRVATAGLAAAADIDAETAAGTAVAGEPWQVSKHYWAVLPRSVMAQVVEALKDRPDSPFSTYESVDDMPFVVADEVVTTRIDGDKWVPAKERALMAHRTQITLDAPFFALSNKVGQRTWGIEYYQLVHGNSAGERDEDGRETDLFAGVDP
jgi:N-acetyl-1-D-myo-inositol-2-amino-2-deoxy-alpha-D-glucopyranoside deacetylase